MPVSPRAAARAGQPGPTDLGPKDHELMPAVRPERWPKAGPRIRAAASSSCRWPEQSRRPGLTGLALKAFANCHPPVSPARVLPSLGRVGNQPWDIRE